MYLQLRTLMLDPPPIERYAFATSSVSPVLNRVRLTLLAKWVRRDGSTIWKLIELHVKHARTSAAESIRNSTSR